MVKDDLLDISAVSGRKIISIDFFHIKALPIKPIFTFSLPFPLRALFSKNLQQLISFTVDKPDLPTAPPGLNAGLRRDAPDDLSGNVF